MTKTLRDRLNADDPVYLTIGVKVPSPNSKTGQKIRYEVGKYKASELPDSVYEQGYAIALPSPTEKEKKDGTKSTSTKESGKSSSK